MNRIFVSLVALLGGGLLAMMIALNGKLMAFVSPIYASWIAHATGAIAALFIVQWVRYKRTAEATANLSKAPTWSFFGGIPGAFVVVLAVITVNSTLGFTGTLVLSITGQILFSLITDQWGWFGFAKRVLTARRLVSSLLIFFGSMLIVVAKGQL
ncbi:DMT family transporter [Reinekea marina]|uniref:DMT family transporter n=2 Tax=Reinekea marina TaxID=1310421 RepID=A0ABV7WXJ2_9GAMM